MRRTMARHEITLNVDGVEHTLELDTRTTLLDLLRERLGLTGSKKGCDHRLWGACAVLGDGLRVNSCLALAVSHDGAAVTSIEGLAENGGLHPLQRSFIKHDAFQCGYCTPGLSCSAVGFLEGVERGWASHATGDLAAPVALDDDEIRER